MVHISEVSNSFVQDIAAVLHEGETVKVKVINVSPEGKIALSIKQLLPAPERPAREGGRGGRPAGSKEGRGGGRGPRRPKEDGPRVWQPKPPARSDNLSFEDMSRADAGAGMPPAGAGAAAAERLFARTEPGNTGPAPQSGGGPVLL